MSTVGPASHRRPANRLYFHFRNRKVNPKISKDCCYHLPSTGRLKTGGSLTLYPSVNDSLRYTQRHLSVCFCACRLSSPQPLWLYGTTLAEAHMLSCTPRYFLAVKLYTYTSMVSAFRFYIKLFKLFSQCELSSCVVSIGLIPKVVVHVHHVVVEMW